MSLTDRKLVSIRSEANEITNMTISKLHDNFFTNINGCLGNTICPDDKDRIVNKTGKCDINICVYSDNSIVKNRQYNKKKAIYIGKCAISSNGRQFVITLNKEIKHALAKIFPFTEGMRILGETGDLVGGLQEQLGICSIKDNENSAGGWLLYPCTQACANSGSKELDTLIDIIRKYGKKPHLDKHNSQVHENSKRNHAIRLEKSTCWYNAEEYKDNITTWRNCIYTLASEPDENGKCRVYIGEASNPITTNKRRISTFNINGKVYIDHTREEAKKNKFVRFRIDKLLDDSTEYLHDMQDLAIGIPFMLRKECPNGFVMTNDAQGQSFNDAIIDDKIMYGNR